MLQKQGIDISFAQGLDTKTDPKRVQSGKFLQLQNSVFQKGGLLQKRNGYGMLTSLPSTNYSYLTTFNGDMTAIGSNIAAYGIGSEQWIQKGSLQPVSTSVLPLIRNNLNQVYADSAIAANGYICTAYIEQSGTTYTNKYVIADSVTGQNLVPPTAITVISGTVSGGMRVYYLAPFFIIIFTNTTAGPSVNLQFLAINASTFVIANPFLDFIASPYLPYTTDYITGLPSQIMPWDAAVGSNGRLYVVYPTSSSTFVTYITASLTVEAPTDLGTPSFLNAISVDSTVTTPVVYVWSVTTATSVEFYILDQNLAVTSSSHITALTPYVPNSSGLGTQNFGSVSFGGVSYAYFEIRNASADPTVKFLVTCSASATNTGGTASIAIKGMALASKPFVVSDLVYAMGIYDSTYQPTYFVIPFTSTDVSPIISAKLAYENGGGTLPYGLPNVGVSSTTATVPYLFKDLIQAVNKGTALTSGTQTAGIYSQTGINLASFDFTTAFLDTAEIGNDLHLTGGFLWMYDGYLPVEHNFFLWPDNIGASFNATSGVMPTGTWTSGATTITVSSGSGIFAGMTITDTTNSTYIPAGTTILSVSGTTVVISQATTHAASGDSLSIQGNIAAQPDSMTNTNAYYYQVTYEWTDNQGNAFRSAPSIPISVTTTGSGTTGTITLNGPMLRATMKTANPVKIVIYRWSVFQQNYYQVTSITAPLLNDTTADTWHFTDTLPDSAILGNNLIYTTGGVIEDVNAPASNLLTLFDSRLWLVDAEDPNLVWFSKQVIEATPVEMSDLLTIYIPPNTGTNISTGPITAISTMDDKVIFFKKNAIIYINGAGPDNTGANNQYSPATFITSTVGCSNQYSVVLMPNGLMFQSDKGIWLLDRGLGTTYIGAPVESLTLGATVNSAVLVPETNQVRFTMSSGITLMYDYYYDQWGTFVGAPAISSCIFQNLHSFINSSGQVFQETPGLYADGPNAVQMMFQTGPINFGMLQGYERVYFFYILGQYFSPHTLNVSLYYDYAQSPAQSILIKPVQLPNPYGSQSPYGQGNPYGGSENASALPPEIEQWRIFPATQRCQAISIQIQEIFDATLGTVPGAGLSLSGINAVIGFKRPFRPQPAAISAG